jgi:hypothetical protein
MPPTGAKKPETRSTTTTYRFIGNHAEILESGQPLAPGEYVDLDPTTDMIGCNRTLLEDGDLVEAIDYVPEVAAAETAADKEEKE